MPSTNGSKYISRKTVAESYRPKGVSNLQMYGFITSNTSIQLMSPGLQRARAQYFWKNAISGLLLGAFAVGVWAYSISAVKQDEFNDVDEEARELRESGVVLRSLEDEDRDKKKAAAGAHGEDLILEKIVHEPEVARGGAMPQRPMRGVLVHLLDRRFPRLLDPERKTLVWGAPPVDNIGTMKDPSKAWIRRN
jgi:cytochrome c oxidase assembly factor 3